VGVVRFFEQLAPSTNEHVAVWRRALSRSPESSDRSKSTVHDVYTGTLAMLG